MATGNRKPLLPAALIRGALSKFSVLLLSIRDPNTSPEQPGDPWRFRVESLVTTIRKACQKYWIPEAHLVVDEYMIPYFGHTRHTIKAPHKSIKKGYKFWALADLGYIHNWL